jgi:hypothetical protein
MIMQGQRESGTDHAGHGFGRGSGDAQVELQEPAEEPDVLEQQRIVQAVGLPVLLLRVLAGTLAEGAARLVAGGGLQDEEHQQGDAQDHQRQGCQPSAQQAQYGGQCILRTGLGGAAHTNEGNSGGGQGLEAAELF